MQYWEPVLNINWAKVIANIQIEPDHRLRDMVLWFDEPNSPEEREQRKNALFEMWDQGWQEISTDDIDSPYDATYRSQRMFAFIVAGFAKAEQYRRGILKG
jgi:hypothetical protein